MHLTYQFGVWEDAAARQVPCSRAQLPRAHIFNRQRGRRTLRPTATSSILSVGELLWDLLPSGPRLGGTTTNFAILSARLGDYVALVSRVGEDDFGEQALRLLEGVVDAAATRGHFDLSHVQRSQLLPTGTVGVKLDEKGRPRYSIEGPAAWDEIALTHDLLALVVRASAVYFGTLAQRQNPSRDSIRALVNASSAECVRVCDVNLRMPFCSTETLRWCLRQATVLKISDEELPEVARLLGMGSPVAAPVEDDQALTKWAHTAAVALLDMAPRCRMVAITLGPHGSLLANRRGAHRHRGFAVQVVDTIGAGDAFTAGMVHAFMRGATLEQINLVSNLCGSFVASQPGATPELTVELLEKIESALGRVAG
jgi:fructokinase